MKIPRGMTLFIGAPGSGKTTLCAYFAKRFFKSKEYKDKNIFSNVPILGCKVIDPQTDMGRFLIEDGVVIIDEGGIEFNNRQYKSLSKDIIKFGKLYRHYGISSFLFFSQGMDIDVTWVRLCDRICLVRKSYIPFFICVQEVRKFIGIDELSKQLVDQYEFQKFGKHLIFAPLCWKLFDTYETPPLPSKSFAIWNNKNRFTSTPDFTPLPVSGAPPERSGGNSVQDVGDSMSPMS